MMMRRALIPILATLVCVVSPALARAGTNDVVTFSTSLGNINVQLLPQYAPKTVANFLSYVQSGAYASTFFHRSEPGFVIQGGGYSLDGSGNVQTIPTTAPVTNEFRVSNTRGTLAMAKLSGDPNSATDEWFFNLANNSANLDSNNGGYTVFGQVADQDSLNVMDQVAAQTVCNESATMGSPFSELPLRNYTANDCSASARVTSQNLIMSPITVTSLDTTPPVISVTQPSNGEQLFQGQQLAPKFSCTDPGGTGVQSCAAPAVDTSSVGPHVLTVTGTDYAGNTGSASVSYTVLAPQSTTTTTTPAAPSPKPAPKPKPAASPAPSLAGSLTASRSGKVLVPLRCSAAARCAGTATLYALGIKPAHGKTIKRQLMAHVRYSVAAHKTAKLTVHLSSRVLALLRRGSSRRIRVSFVLAPDHGTTHDKTVTFTLPK